MHGTFEVMTWVTLGLGILLLVYSATTVVKRSAPFPRFARKSKQTWQEMTWQASAWSSGLVGLSAMLQAIPRLSGASSGVVLVFTFVALLPVWASVVVLYRLRPQDV